MISSDLKLSLFRKIDGLSENLLVELNALINDFLSKKKKEVEKDKALSYEERLKIIKDAATHLTVKEDFEAYMKDFEESTQDRPLPFRES